MAMTDTICALASGAPPSAIAIIRISGPATGAVISSLLSPARLDPRRMTRLRVSDRSGNLIDEGLGVWFPRPSSYTGEDCLELYLHGGRAVVEETLDACLSIPSVRLAEPGEFTRRAFEAGKIDLTQAEGIADLIDAETRAQREQALRQLGGKLSGQLADWRRSLLEAMALVEVAVDFPDEEDAPDFTHDDALGRIQSLLRELDRALDDGRLGEKVRDGFRIALVGAPNAGKSSLLNRLAGRDAAIVTDIPGTTRDVVEVRLDIAGHLVWLQDTAGLRESTDPIEREGIARAHDTAQSADLRMLVIDPSLGDDEITRQVGKLLRAGDLVLANKSDLKACANVSRETLAVSALTGEGIDALVLRLGELISARLAGQPAPLVTRRRHRDRLQRAQEHLRDAAQLLETCGPAELAAEDLRLATRALTELVGEIGVEDILGEVFATFCIGK
jgi:tRNA modification GTPase